MQRFIGSINAFTDLKRLLYNFNFDKNVANEFAELIKQMKNDRVGWLDESVFFLQNERFTLKWKKKHLEFPK